jgi:hypothetical protein
VSIDVDAVAAAARSCGSVARLSPGPFGDVASYLPHRRVVGVRETANQLEVRIVAKWNPSLARVGEEVRAAVRPVAGHLPVEVFIDDIELPSGTQEAVGEGVLRYDGR